jgi:hypothetical protein
MCIAPWITQQCANPIIYKWYILENRSVKKSAYLEQNYCKFCEFRICTVYSTIVTCLLKVGGRGQQQWSTDDFWPVQANRKQILPCDWALFTPIMNSKCFFFTFMACSPKPRDILHYSSCHTVGYSVSTSDYSATLVSKNSWFCGKRKWRKSVKSVLFICLCLYFFTLLVPKSLFTVCWEMVL